MLVGTLSVNCYHCYYFSTIITCWLQVLKPVAAATSKVRALKGLSLKESVSQFSSTMTAQADLRVECAHLRRFYNNFASVSQSVTPPYPFPGCETAEVLIETFEPGTLYSLDRTDFNMVHSINDCFRRTVITIAITCDAQCSMLYQQ